MHTVSCIWNEACDGKYEMSPLQQQNNSRATPSSHYRRQSTTEHTTKQQQEEAKIKTLQQMFTGLLAIYASCTKTQAVYFV
jgi:hypothetical protein